MIKLEFDGGLEICSNYQEQAMKALKELTSEVDSYQERQESAANRKKKYAAVAGAGGEQILPSLKYLADLTLSNAVFAFVSLSFETYRIFSIKRRTPIKRRPRINAGSKRLFFK